MRILVATMNAGKLREYERLLADVPGLELETMASLSEPVDVVEDRDTFRGNALKKATEIATVAGMPCLADDSGLEVDALGSLPLSSTQGCGRRSRRRRCARGNSMLGRISFRTSRPLIASVPSVACATRCAGGSRR